ncbi:MAG: hypothetical protein FIA82_11925 [Melioribacter sp.]|nr:hypothetical protein [Melioribacter sp.]
MIEQEAKIFDAVKNGTYNKPITSRIIYEKTGIDNRMLAACIRKMNEENKGIFHIGSDKRGYYLCRTEEEAIASMLSYNHTIMSMLGERKKVKEQIRETFGAERNLFGEKLLST